MKPGKEMNEVATGTNSIRERHAARKLAEQFPVVGRDIDRRNRRAGFDPKFLRKGGPGVASHVRRLARPLRGAIACERY